MSSILSSRQRAVVVADTSIDPLIVDRVVEAYDALVRGNVEEYKHRMATAIVQMGYEKPIRRQDRPTAVDVARTIVQKAYADQQRMTFQAATRRLQEMIGG